MKALVNAIVCIDFRMSSTQIKRRQCILPKVLRVFRHISLNGPLVNQKTSFQLLDHKRKFCGPRTLLWRTVNDCQSIWWFAFVRGLPWKKHSQFANSFHHFEPSWLLYQINILPKPFQRKRLRRCTSLSHSTPVPFVKVISDEPLISERAAVLTAKESLKVEIIRSSLVQMIVSSACKVSMRYTSYLTFFRKK